MFERIFAALEKGVMGEGKTWAEAGDRAKCSAVERPAGISARVKSGVDLLLHLSVQASLEELL